MFLLALLSARHDVFKHKEAPKAISIYIDNNDLTSSGKNSTQVRRHVMQDYMREKRWQARVRANSGDESESTAQSRQKKLALQSRTRQQKPSNESARNCDLPRTAKALSSLANSQGIDDPRNLSFETFQEAPYHASEHRVKGLKRSRFYLDATAFAKLFDLEQNHSEASSNRPSILLSTDFSCSPWFQAGQFSQPQSMLSAA